MRGVAAVGTTDGQKTPPAYNLANVTVPTALYAGTKDDLADLTDVQTLIDQLPKSTVIHTGIIDGFAHMVRHCCCR